ncbi:MAG: hypothetical protein Fur0042_12500 [Cyanophyceae cyanobacterium]
MSTQCESIDAQLEGIRVTLQSLSARIAQLDIGSVTIDPVARRDAKQAFLMAKKAYAQSLRAEGAAMMADQHAASANVEAKRGQLMAGAALAAIAAMSFGAIFKLIGQVSGIASRGVQLGVQALSNSKTAFMTAKTASSSAGMALGTAQGAKTTADIAGEGASLATKLSRSAEATARASDSKAGGALAAFETWAPRVIEAIDLIGDVRSVSEIASSVAKEGKMTADQGLELASIGLSRSLDAIAVGRFAKARARAALSRSDASDRKASKAVGDANNAKTKSTSAESKADYAAKQAEISRRESDQAKAQSDDAAFTSRKADRKSSEAIDIANKAKKSPGPKGADGRDGRPGKTGRDGRKGTDGRDAKGKKGDPGKNGADGRNGSDGLKGKPGNEGPRGPRGIDGKNGNRGTDGRPGRDGDPGKPGKDARPDRNDRNNPDSDRQKRENDRNKKDNEKNRRDNDRNRRDNDRNRRDNDRNRRDNDETRRDNEEQRKDNDKQESDNKKKRDEEQMDTERIMRELRDLGDAIGVNKLPVVADLIYDVRGTREDHKSLVDLIIWVVKNLDAVTGKFPREIEWLNEDGKTQKVTVDNVAHALDEIILASKLIAEDSDAAVQMAFRATIEAIGAKVAAMQGADFARANATALGYPVKMESKTVKLSVTPAAAGRDGKVQNAELTDTLKPSKRLYPSFKFDDSNMTVLAMLSETMQSASIAKAAVWRKMPKGKEGSLRTERETRTKADRRLKGTLTELKKLGYTVKEVKRPNSSSAT